MPSNLTADISPLTADPDEGHVLAELRQHILTKFAPLITSATRDAGQTLAGSSDWSDRRAAIESVSDYAMLRCWRKYADIDVVVATYPAAFKRALADDLRTAQTVPVTAHAARALRAARTADVEPVGVALDAHNVRHVSTFSDLMLDDPDDTETAALERHGAMPLWSADSHDDALEDLRDDVRAAVAELTVLERAVVALRWLDGHAETDADVVQLIAAFGDQMGLTCRRYTRQRISQVRASALARLRVALAAYAPRPLADDVKA